MKLILLTLLLLPLLWDGLRPAAGADTAALQKLQGKWSGKRTSANGDELRQTIEINGETLIYRLSNADDALRLFAKGTLQAEILGPFHVLKLTGIRAGTSADDTEAIEDRSTIYVLGDETLTLASNFDQDREGQKPAVDTYQRIETPAKGAGVSWAGRLLGKWKVKVKMGESDRDYDLTLSGKEGALTATLTSPRSGEHAFKTVTLSDGKLAMELVRDIQGNEATFLYSGAFKGSELEGTVAVKGFEDQFKGTWTAQKQP